MKLDIYNGKFIRLTKSEFTFIQLLDVDEFEEFNRVIVKNLCNKMNMNMMGTLDGPRGDIEPGTHT